MQAVTSIGSLEGIDTQVAAPLRSLQEGIELLSRRKEGGGDEYDDSALLRKLQDLEDELRRHKHPSEAAAAATTNFHHICDTWANRPDASLLDGRHYLAVEDTDYTYVVKDGVWVIIPNHGSTIQTVGDTNVAGDDPEYAADNHAHAHHTDMAHMYTGAGNAITGHFRVYGGDVEVYIGGAWHSIVKWI